MISIIATITFAAFTYVNHTINITESNVIYDGSHAIFTGSSNIQMYGNNIIAKNFFFEKSIDYNNDHAVISFMPGTHNNSLLNSSIYNMNPENPSHINDFTWVNIWGYGHTVDHCNFTNKINDGQLLRVRSEFPSMNHIISNNRFINRSSIEGSINGNEVIQIGYLSPEKSTNVTINHNFFYNNTGADIEIISVKSSNNKITHNTFLENYGGISLRMGNTSTVDSNFIVCNNKENCMGIRVRGRNHIITNNYISEGPKSDNFDTFSSIALYSDDTIPAVDVFIAYNSIINCTGCITLGNTGQGLSQGGNSFLYNLIFGRNESIILIKTFPAYITSTAGDSIPNIGALNVWTGNVLNNKNVVYDKSIGLYTIIPSPGKTKLIANDDIFCRKRNSANINVGCLIPFIAEGSVPVCHSFL